MKRIILTLALAVGVLLFKPYGGDVQAQTVFKPITDTMNLAYGSASVQATSAFTSQTRWARLVCTTACFVQLGPGGTSPIAFSTGVTTSMFLPANVPATIKVDRGGAISVIRLSSDGTLYIQELGQ
tara:strand:- start:6532 stop:6909 length:378 start_codon:yes stop_codon:yes gene_type:complete